MINPVELIIKKRQGNKLSEEEINYFITSYVNKTIPDYQMSAMLMAIFCRGMSNQETVSLAKSYVDSGIRFSFEENTVDKHSTGGVGDKVSIVLAPIVAACGGIIPMISGRGLGHTGGTLDKLESIPNFRTNLSEKEFQKFTRSSGFAIATQSTKMVPADKMIYALRDVTGTVESLPLITASIISKKIAEGSKNLVIDLKVGSGAFMKTLEDAKKLGYLLKKAGENFGQKVSILYTNMNSPIGKYIGNSLEIKECIEYLSGKKYPDLDILTKALAVEMLLLCGIEKSSSQALLRVEESLKNGKALEKFSEFIKRQGGDANVCLDISKLPTSKYKLPIITKKSGYIKSINSQKIGYALIDIGSGRKKLTDKLEYSSGASLYYKIGDFIEKDQKMGNLYCNDKSLGQTVIAKILEAYSLSEEKVKKEALIIEKDTC